MSLSLLDWGHNDGNGGEGCPDNSDIVTDLAINDALNGTLCGDKISGYGRYK